MVRGDSNAICITCGAEYAMEGLEDFPKKCIICDEERQYVNSDGQQWTTGQRMLADGRKTEVRQLEDNLWGFSVEPKVGIGQRSLLVTTPKGNVLWDCVCFLDDAALSKIRELGGVSAVVNSHPHFFTRMVDWAHHFGATLYVHKADEAWVTCPDPIIHFWTGDKLELLDGIRVQRLGGHFEGSSVLYWPQGAEARGALLAGDTIFPVPDKGWVSFMYSFPNLIPLPGAVVRKMKQRILDSGILFDRLYGAFWHSVVAQDALEAVIRSADRYVAFVEGTLDRPGFH
eukprot:jgi/Botrbrau1/20648/Bobra.113_1s0072.1